MTQVRILGSSMNFLKCIRHDPRHPSYGWLLISLFL